MPASPDLSAVGIQVAKPNAPLKPVSFERHQPGPRDVVIKVIYCGICHSDLHAGAGDMGDAYKFPIMPGHEIAGVVEWAGKDVTKLSVGDHAGIGCLVDSCRSCEYCECNDEQYCTGGCTWTYGSEPKHGHAGTGTTKGGYSTRAVADERFVIKVPKELPLEVVGPIMCAGITTFDPLVHWKAGSEHVKRVGIIGGGGLGHMGIKLAKALGCEVTAITTSPSKVEHLSKLGANKVVVSTDPDAMKAAGKTLDLILNTVSAKHEVMHYVPLLRPSGTIVQLGLVGAPHEVCQLPLTFSRNAIAGSLIGGLKATQELVDLCAREKIWPDVDVIPVAKANDVWAELTSKNTLPRRYVLDMATMEDYAKANGV